jgi:hypothetical protein
VNIIVIRFLLGARISTARLQHLPEIIELAALVQEAHLRTLCCIPKCIYSAECNLWKATQVRCPKKQINE